MSERGSQSDEAGVRGRLNEAYRPDVLSSLGRMSAIYKTSEWPKTGCRPYDESICPSRLVM